MRKERNWSQQRAFEALREGLGFGPKSRASYAAIDMGKRPPTMGESAFLVSYFGKSPDDLPEVPEPTEPVDALVAALTAQTEAISALVTRLDSLAATAIREGVADGVAQAVLDPTVGASLALPRAERSAQTPRRLQPTPRDR
jgi:hypothetical protein